ncbi:MAG: glutamate racemase [Candidatus Omnitrophica bacterium]|nr:glutamate racemase [Candidatus Omnitrophota bacterium]
MDKRPIGVFDSGVGGLTVVDKIRKFLPNEDIIYFGDTARVPYGNKSRDTVTGFSREIIKFLLKFRVKLIIVACNTASSLSVNALKKEFNVPILGVIRAGVKEAMNLSKNKRIGVIGTNATIKSGVYKKCIKTVCKKTVVKEEACPLFVPLVENKCLSGDIAVRVVKKYLAPLLKNKIDTLILGCTHYPLLKGVIAKISGKRVKLVDSSSAVAKFTKEFLKAKRMSASPEKKGRTMFFVSDDGENFRELAKIFLKKKITAKKAIL